MVHSPASVLSLTFRALLIFAIASISLAPALVPDVVSGDGGIIPYKRTDVYETAQNAIVAWNGTDEVLILSVDVEGANSTKALHVVPFPSRPEVTLGSPDIFYALENLTGPIVLHERPDGTGGDNMGGGEDGDSHEVVDRQVLGPHDILTILVNRSAEFVDWVTGFLEEEGVEEAPLPDDLESVIDHYLDKGMNYFVFDIIEVPDGPAVVEPLVYTFSTEKLVFPLHISSIIEGDSLISLFFITPPNLPWEFANASELGFRAGITLGLDNEQLSTVDDSLADMFAGGNALLQHYYQRVILSELEDDLELVFTENVKWVYHCAKGNSIWDRGKIRAADVDGDGVADVVVNQRDNVYVLDGNDGTISMMSDYRTAAEKLLPREPFVADGDGDGTLDVIAHTPWAVVAMDGASGDLIWSYDTSGDWVTAIDLVDDSWEGGGLILVKCNESLRALNVNGGKEVWNIAADISHRETWPLIVNTDADSRAELVYPHANYPHAEQVVAINAEDGSTLWTFDIDRDNTRFFLVEDMDSDGQAEVRISGIGGVWVLNGSTGDVLWEYLVPGERRIGPGTAADITFDGTLDVMFTHEDDENHSDVTRIIDGKTGDVLWDVARFPSPPYASYTGYAFVDIDSDGQAEIVDYYNGNLSAYTPAGSLLWTNVYDFKGHPGFLGLERVGVRDVILGDRKGLHAFHSENGSLNWSHQWADSSGVRDMGWHELDGGGEPELVLYEYNGLKALQGDDPAKNSTLFNGRMPEYLNITDLDLDGRDEAVIFCDNSIYWIGVGEEPTWANDDISAFPRPSYDPTAAGDPDKNTSFDPDIKSPLDDEAQETDASGSDDEKGFLGEYTRPWTVTVLIQVALMIILILLVIRGTKQGKTESEEGPGDEGRRA